MGLMSRWIGGFSKYELYIRNRLVALMCLVTLIVVNKSISSDKWVWRSVALQGVIYI